MSTLPSSIKRLSHALPVGLGRTVTASAFLLIGLAVPIAAADLATLNSDISNTEREIKGFEDEISLLDTTAKGIESGRLVFAFTTRGTGLISRQQYSDWLAGQVREHNITPQQAVEKARMVGILSRAMLQSIKAMQAEDQAELSRERDRLWALNVQRTHLTHQESPPSEPYLSPGIHVSSATYGRRCGVPVGNVTGHLKSACDGKMACDYVVDYHVIGDPAYGCRKDFIVDWVCGGGGSHTATAGEEAGFGSKVELRC